ncbi:hypothetical protein N7454_010769 [Penicillium verhagenii]|nr:hypothetical protein N7454_010769 [Penicillium verhagenii]
MRGEERNKLLQPQLRGGNAEIITSFPTYSNLLSAKVLFFSSTSSSKIFRLQRYAPPHGEIALGMRNSGCPMEY